MPEVQREINMGACSSVQKNNEHDSGVHPRIIWRSKKMQVEGVTDEEIRTLIEDIKKMLREDLLEFETNQQVIRMKWLFRGFSIKA